MPLMELEFAKHRLRAFCDELRELMESEFPYPDAKASLAQLRELFQNKLQRLEHFTAQSSPQTIKQECSRSLHALFMYLLWLASLCAQPAFGTHSRFTDRSCESLVPYWSRAKHRPKEKPILCFLQNGSTRRSPTAPFRSYPSLFLLACLHLNPQIRC